MPPGRVWRGAVGIFAHEGVKTAEAVGTNEK